MTDSEPTIDFEGTRKWCKDGKLHRDGDLPAKVDKQGNQWWYKDAELHRDGDLPAIVYSYGSKYWYKHGKLHRDVGPASISYYFVADGVYNKFFEHGTERGIESIRGETLVARSFASWSPVLCFI